MAVQGGEYRRFVLRPIIEGVKQVDRAVKLQCQLRAQVRVPGETLEYLRHVFGGAGGQIGLEQLAQGRVVILLQGEHPAEGGGKWLLGPVGELSPGIGPDLVRRGL